MCECLRAYVRLSVCVCRCVYMSVYLCVCLASFLSVSLSSVCVFVFMSVLVSEFASISASVFECLPARVLASKSKYLPAPVLTVCVCNFRYSLIFFLDLDCFSNCTMAWFDNGYVPFELTFGSRRGSIRVFFLSIFGASFGDGAYAALGARCNGT